MHYVNIIHYILYHISILLVNHNSAQSTSLYLIFIAQYGIIVSTVKPCHDFSVLLYEDRSRKTGTPGKGDTV